MTFFYSELEFACKICEYECKCKKIWKLLELSILITSNCGARTESATKNMQIEKFYCSHVKRLGLY